MIRAAILLLAILLCASVTQAAPSDTPPVLTTAEELAAIHTYEDSLLAGSGKGESIDQAMNQVVSAGNTEHGAGWWTAGVPIPQMPSSSWDRSVLNGLDAIGRGREIFQRTGCYVCHGQNGQGGVPNYNYIKDTYPQLSTLATRMFIRDLETQKSALAVLSSGQGLDEEIDSDDINIPKVVSAQYTAVVKIIQNGNPAQIKEPSGPPPMFMPTWGPVLSPADIRDILAYLISLPKYQAEDDE